jgi:prepilin-type processing-associated H-X9-DG protein
MLPAIIWWLACTSIASFGMVELVMPYLPFGAAIAAGIVMGVILGTIFAFVAAQTAGSGVTTVVELNVSCCICLVLTGILFPVFGQAREKARQTSCASNLKTISGAMLMYAQDYDDLFPPAENRMDSVDAFCPPSPKGKAKGSVYHCPSVNGKSTYGYAYNSNVASQTTVKIADPRAKMLLYDSTTQARSASDPGTSLPSKGRHSGGNTIAFADGHARWIKDGDDRATSSEDSPTITP